MLTGQNVSDQQFGGFTKLYSSGFLLVCFVSLLLPTQKLNKCSVSRNSMGGNKELNNFL